MSYLTEVVLHVDYDYDAVVRLHLSQVPVDGRFQHFAMLETEHAGGSKVYTGDVYAACFNYVSSETVVQYLSAISWPCVAAAAIIEEDGRVTTWKHEHND